MADVEEPEDTLAAVEEFANRFDPESVSKPPPNIRSKSIPKHHRNTMLPIPRRLRLRQQIPCRLPHVHKRRGTTLPDLVPEARDAEFLAHAQRDAAGEAHQRDVSARAVVHGHWVVEAAGVGSGLDAEVGGARADAGPGAGGVEDYGFWEAGCAAGECVSVFLCGVVVMCKERDITGFGLTLYTRGNLDQSLSLLPSTHHQASSEESPLF